MSLSCKMKWVKLSQVCGIRQKSYLLPADRFKQEFFVSDFPQTKNKVHEKCYAKGLQNRSWTYTCCLTIRAAEISNKRIFVFYQHISHVGLTPIVYNLGLEIGFILVSSRIGTINDGAPETLKTKTWIRSKKFRQSDKKENLVNIQRGYSIDAEFSPD